MEQPPFVTRSLIKPAPGSYVELASNDRLDTSLVCLFIKLDGTIHSAMISDGYRDHVVGGSPLQKRIDADCPIKEAVLCVHMEVDEISGGHCYNFGFWILDLRFNRNRALL